MGMLELMELVGNKWKCQAQIDSCKKTNSGVDSGNWAKSGGVENISTKRKSMKDATHSVLC